MRCRQALTRPHSLPLEFHDHHLPTTLRHPDMTTNQTIAALSIMSDNSHAPRANFPLPRELRDLIYGHLLDSVNAREVRLKGSRDSRERAGKGYHFCTNVLLVNKAIHAEGQYRDLRP